MHSISARLLHDARATLAGAPTPAGHNPRSKASARGDLHDVYFRLRQGIISGEIAPREILNQVHIAQQFGVSRTPVREALRMLQTENLVETQYQHRVRVTEVTPGEVDSVYGTWILIQALGTALTVPKLDASELQSVRAALDQMHKIDPAHSGMHSEWDGAHSVFHRTLVMHAGPVILESIESCWSRSERARRAYSRTAPKFWMESEEEHEGLVNAYSERDVSTAVFIASRQLARIARIVIGSIDPSYEPVAIKQSLNLLNATPPEPKASKLAKKR